VIGGDNDRVTNPDVPFLEKAHFYLA
jgi:hypothetical protein